TALGCPVQLSKNNAGNTRGFGELAGLLETVLSGSCVEHEPDFMRRTGHNPLAGPAHFLQFGHQVFFRMKAARRIDDYVIHSAGLGRLQSVENDGTRIRSSLLADHVDRGALRPDFQLLNGRRAEGIGSTEQNLSAFAKETVREFADGGGLPGP